MVGFGDRITCMWCTLEPRHGACEGEGEQLFEVPFGCVRTGKTARLSAHGH